MPRVSQNLYGSPKRRLQPILILDEPLPGVPCTALQLSCFKPGFVMQPG